MGRGFSLSPHGIQGVPRKRSRDDLLIVTVICGTESGGKECVPVQGGEGPVQGMIIVQSGEYVIGE